MFRTFLTALVVTAAAAAAQPPQPSPAPTPPNPEAPQPAQPARKYKLMVGDPAPALLIDEWVKGDPVTAFEKGKVYLIEFWATWCPPCIAAMPHLSALQEKHRDAGLTVIGVTSKDNRNSLDAVERMVEDKGQAMAYTVGWDEDRQAWKTFMDPSGRGGIPCSFLINKDGRIAYIGHPLAVDETLAQVTAGTHDIDKAATDYARQLIVQEQMRPLNARLNRAAMQREWDAAMAVTDEIEALDPGFFRPQLAFTRFGLMLSKGDYDRASIFAREAIDGPARDDADLLNRIAWMIVDPEGDAQIKDLDVALAAAQRAVELSGGEHPSYLDTLATVHHLRGEHDKAVEVQARALELDPDDPEIKARLDEFTAARDKARGKG